MRRGLFAVLVVALGCDGGGSGAGGSAASSGEKASSTGSQAPACLPLDYFGCSDTHACCPGAHCFAPQGRCVSDACIDYGELCREGSCCPSRECYLDAPCCNLVASDPCSSDAECCTHACDPKTHRCACSPPGGHCSYAEGDCCGQLGLCTGPLGKLTGTCCVDFQGPCNQPSDCCSGICGAGHCQ